MINHQKKSKNKNPKKFKTIKILRKIYQKMRFPNKMKLKDKKISKKNPPNKFEAKQLPSKNKILKYFKIKSRVRRNMRKK